MNEIEVRVSGTVATDLRHVVTQHGLPITSFRMVSTVRKWEPRGRQFVDGDSTWLNVTCFRTLAINVAGSVHKGDPVVVTGRLRVRDWKTEDRSGTSVEIEAGSVGHELMFGISRFARVSRVERVQPPGRAEADGLVDQIEAECRDGEDDLDPEYRETDREGSEPQALTAVP